MFHLRHVRRSLYYPRVPRTTTTLHTHPSTPSATPPKNLPPTFPTSQPIPLSASPPYTKIGLVSGTLGSMCGVGGAVFAIPLLMRFANHSQRFAAGNSLVAVTCIAATAATSFCTQKDVNVDIPVAASLGIPAALATPIGAVAARYVSGSGLRKALGTFMLILAPLMPLREHLESTRGENGDKRQSEMGMRVMGGIVGMASGLLGISGGSLFTPLIAVSCPDLSFKSVLGTSFAAMLLPTAIGALSYARMGLVSVNVVPRLVLGAVGGGVIGSAAALAVPDEQLRWGFACVFAIMGLRTLRAPVKPASAVRNATAAG